MWWGLAFCALAAVVPGQAGKLQIDNVRATLGFLGPPRPDAKYLPGDVVHLTFDLGGAASDKLGRVHFVTTLELYEVKDGQSKLLVKQKLGDTLQVNVQGVGRLRLAVHVTLPGDQSPGEYQIGLSVEDVIGKSSGRAAAPFAFTVLPRDFGLVQFQVYYRYTPEVQVPAPCIGVVGQTLHVTALLSRGKEEKAWSADVEFLVLDEQGKPLTAQPLRGEFRNLPADLAFLDFRFDFPVQRAGNFQLQLKATDPVARRTVVLNVPFVAVDAK